MLFEGSSAVTASVAMGLPLVYFLIMAHSPFAVLYYIISINDFHKTINRFRHKFPYKIKPKLLNLLLQYGIMIQCIISFERGFKYVWYLRLYRQA